jgi:sugar phosphate isomerase/epimerase
MKHGKIGVALYNEFRGSIESFLNFLSNAGIDYVEIGKDWIPTRRELGGTKDLLEIYQLEATLHISNHYNLAELDKKKWKRNILGVLGDLSVCYEIGAKSAVLHCGWVSQPKDLAKGYERFGEAYEIISNFAKDLDVKIGLENQCSEGLKHYIFEDHESIDKLSEFIEPEDMFFVLDVGHSGRRGTPLDEIVSRMGDRLIEIHLHDYNELGVDHLPLGTGRLDVKKVLKVMEEKTPLVTLENKSVKWIRDSISYLRKLWD